MQKSKHLLPTSHQDEKDNVLTFPSQRVVFAISTRCVCKSHVWDLNSQHVGVEKGEKCGWKRLLIKKKKI